MKWSWNVGKIVGIDLKIHPTFVFLLIWVGFYALFSGGTIATMSMEILFILALFLSVVLHELGHALAARGFGIKTQDITLLPIGGVARLEKMPEDPKEELVVSLAGPSVNVVIAGLLFGVLLLTGTFALPLEISVLMDNFWVRLLSVNLSLMIFNLIPAFPMDGGRVLRALLALRMDYVKATGIAANIGKGFAVLMGLAGLVWNPWLMMIAFFVWSGAGAEAQTVATKADLKGLRVRDAMISQFYQVEANQPIDSVFQLAMETGQHNIPVVSNGNYLGIIRRNDLMKALEHLGNRAPAYAAIGIEPDGLDADLDLVEVLPKFATNRVLPVLEGRQLIGLVTPESVQQRMWLKRKLKAVDQKPPEEKIDPIV